MKFKTFIKNRLSAAWRYETIVTIIHTDAEIILCTFDGTLQNILNVSVADVDTLCKKYRAHGLDISGKKDSPVHKEPINQTWGMREFYVTDSDGHSLHFGRPIV